MSKQTPIVLLHGLGSHPITLKPLEWYLHYCGYTNTHNIHYPVDTLSFDGMIDFVDAELAKRIDRSTEIILIGQSMGGVVANSLHKKNWKIRNAIYIGSPLHGARLLNQLPQTLINLIHKPPYDFLKSKTVDETPPHPYHTISMGWACSNFDGCVYRDETTLDKKNHTHLAWSDHRTIFMNPRLWYRVEKLISN